MEKITCGFIGLGLIGGSVARSLREASQKKDNNCDIRIIAYDSDMLSIDMAIADGVVNTALPAIDDRLGECDYIFLCAPVENNIKNLETLTALASFDRKKMLITDVGSVKSPIHDRIIELGLTDCFIGGHPMAGSERTGYRNSSALLLQNAYYILTPEKNVPQEKVQAYIRLVKMLGALPINIEPERHDRITAAISHLPHLVAFSLVNMVRDIDEADGMMRTIAAGGFKDITRIASSSPRMWEQICLTNADNILWMMDKYIDTLKDIRENLALSQGSVLYDYFDEAREYRDSFSNSSYGPIKKAFDIYINIADEPGVIAQISTTLAVHRINIKNLGIIHNRELAEGALRMELYSEDDVKIARELLTQKGYDIVK